MQYQIGQGRIMQRTLKQSEFDLTARLSGDYNPIHVDPEFAAKTRFKKTVAHGMFLYGLISNLIDELIPGGEPVEQDLIFPFPAFAGEDVFIWIGIKSVSKKSNLIELDNLITRMSGEVCLKGKTLIKIPEEKE